MHLDGGYSLEGGAMLMAEFFLFSVERKMVMKNLDY